MTVSARAQAAYRRGARAQAAYRRGLVSVRGPFQWRYSPTALWPTERPPPVSEEGCHVVSATDPHGR